MSLLTSIIKQPLNSMYTLQFNNKGIAKNGKLSILLIGSSEHCRSICESIYSFNKNNERIPVIISQSETIEQILTSSSPVHVDFVVFLMKTQNRHCIESVERNMCLIESAYLCDRILLVNGCNHLKPIDRGLSDKELFNLAQKYRLRILNANLENKDSQPQLAKSILNLAKLTCGLKTEIPIVLDFPTDIFPL